MLVCFIVMIGIIIGTALKLPYKQEVTGSIPVSPTIIPSNIQHLAGSDF